MIHPKTPPLPPTNVEVTSTTSPSGDVQVDANLSRSGANAGRPRHYTGSGATTEGAVRDLLERVLSDPVTGEFIGR